MDSETGGPIEQVEVDATHFGLRLGLGLSAEIDRAVARRRAARRDA